MATTRVMKPKPPSPVPAPPKPAIAAIYARVSTVDQHCEMQLTELGAFAERMCWQRIDYVEKASGKAGSKRPVLAQLLADARMRKFDTVLVWKLDRFGRSLSHLVENIQTLDQMGIRFMAPSQSIDTDRKNPMSKLIIHLLGAIAEFERDLIAERVAAGVAQYKRDFEAGRVGKDRQSRSGKNMAAHRPLRVFDRAKARKLRAAGKSYRVISAALSVPISTLVREFKRG